MKQHILFLAVLASLLTVACDKLEPQPPTPGPEPKEDPVLTVDENQQQVSVGAEAGTFEVTVQSNVDYKVSSSAAWLRHTGTKAVTSKTLSFSYDANDGAQERSATVTVSAGDLSRQITVTQAPGTFPDEDWYAVNFWRRTDRQKMGLRGPVKTYTTHSLPHTTYHFDEAGRLVEEEYFDIEDKLDQRKTYSYDAQGRLVRKEVREAYDGFASVISVTEYEYKNEGKLVSQDYYWTTVDLTQYSTGTENWDWRDCFVWDLSRTREAYGNPIDTYITTKEYAFDASGNLTISEKETRVDTPKFEQQGFDAPGDDSETKSYQIVYRDGLPYESNYYEGLIQRFTWQENGMPATFYKKKPEEVYVWFGDMVEEASWLVNGRILAIENYLVPQGYAGSWMPEVMKKNTFNEYSDILTSDHMHGDNYKEDGYVYHDWYASYDYDRYGNWTSRTEYVIPIFMGEEAAHETTDYREITYY